MGSISKSSLVTYFKSRKDPESNYNGHDIDENEIKELIANGADVNFAFNDGWTPLLLACANQICPPKIIKLLIDNGANIHLQNDNKDVALTIACKNAVEIVELLIKNGADVHYQNNGYTALMQASSLGKTKTVKLLIEYGSDVNAKMKKDWTVLHRACRYSKDDEIVKLLLDNEAEVNEITNDGETALIIACKEGNEKMVCHLLEYGANISIKDKNGYDAEHWARYWAKECEHPTVLKILKNPPKKKTNIEKEIFQASVNWNGSFSI